MDFRMIQSPSMGTIDILKRRIAPNSGAKLDHIGAIGLIQGKVIDMIWAADIAEKAVGVTVEDVRGSCPQNLVTIAILGDISSVQAALDAIKRKNEENRR